MGCFNTVILKCPACGTENEHQSKAGDSTLARHTFDDPKIDLRDLADAAAIPHKCDGCNRDMSLSVKTIVLLGVLV